jgi:hypothetical protein
MAFIDGTVINVATAKLQINFSATAAQVQWVVEAYALTLSALLLLGGRLGDLYGHKRLFIWGNVLFAVSSLLCAISGSLPELVAARGVQGIAAAMLVPGSFTLITSSYPAAERARAIGIWSGTTALMAAIGPFLGGWLIDHLSWRMVFYVNIPLAAIAAFDAFRVADGRISIDRRASRTVSAMHLARLSIANFRGISHATLLLQKQGVLTRNNNTCKTAVLEASELTLGPDRLNRRPPIGEHDFYNGHFLKNYPDATAKLVDALGKYFAWSKGTGEIADFLAQRTEAEMPAWIKEAANSLKGAGVPPQSRAQNPALAAGDAHPEAYVDGPD